MENNKYYVPIIEEFHVGFEYEELTDDNQWVKVIIDNVCELEFISNSLNYKNGANIRVKYLDSADIKELGWKFIKKAIDDWFEIEGNFDRGSWTSYRAVIHYGYYDNRLTVLMYDGSYGSEAINGLIVKNKSELKKLMQQLNMI